MGSYVKRAMQKDEKILYAAQLHWIIYKMAITILVIGGLVGHMGIYGVQALFGNADWALHLVAYIKDVAIGIVGLGAFEAFFSYIRQISTELVITNQRVIAKHGFISTTSYELMLPKVEGATIDQTIVGRLLGYGTLMVKGTGGGISPIDHVADPYKFHSELMDALRLVHGDDRNPAKND